MAQKKLTAASVAAIDRDRSHRGGERFCEKGRPGGDRAEQESIFSPRLRNIARSTGAHVGALGDPECKASADSYFRSELPTPHSITGLVHLFESQGLGPSSLDESAIDVPDLTLDRPAEPRVAETSNPSDFADTAFAEDEAEVQADDEEQPADYGDTLVGARQDAAEPPPTQPPGRSSAR